MLVSVVTIALSAAGLYLGFGFLAGCWLAFTRLGNFDPAAQNGSLGFRLLMIPGLAIFWPRFLFAKARSNVPEERNAHRLKSKGGVS